MVYDILYVELNKISYILYQISYLGYKISNIGYKISYMLYKISNMLSTNEKAYSTSTLLRKSRLPELFMTKENYVSTYCFPG